MADPRSYFFDLPGSKRPSYAKLNEEWFPDIKSAALRTSKSRGRDPIKGVKTVVIHATAGSSSAGAASVIFDGVASFHWLVPDENEPQHGHFVWATCYESRAAFHVRKSLSHPKINGGQKDINRISHERLVIHVAHAAHAAWRHGGSLGLRFLRHHSLGGDEKPRDGAGILQRGPYHLGWVDHALLD